MFVYADNAATTAVSQTAIDAMALYDIHSKECAE